MSAGLQSISASIWPQKAKFLWILVAKTSISNRNGINYQIWRPAYLPFISFFLENPNSYDYYNDQGGVRKGLENYPE